MSDTTERSVGWLPLDGLLELPFMLDLQSLFKVLVHLVDVRLAALNHLADLLIQIS